MIIVLFAAIITVQATAQAPKARVGVTGGVTIANLYGEYSGVNTDYSSKTGFTTGLIVDAPIGKSRFSFQPGLHYIQKGAVISETKDQKVSYALRYAELALNVMYKTPGTKGVQIIAGLGPSVDMNLPSKKVTKLSDDSKTEETLILGNEGAAVIKGIDWGLGGTAGLQFRNGAFITFNYTHGLRNLVPLENGNDAVRNSCMAIRLGWLIKNN